MVTTPISEDAWIPEPARLETIEKRSRRQGLVDRGVLRTLLVIVLCLLGEPTTASFALGVAVVAAGCALHVWAKGCLRIRAEVTSSGPYAWMRNPFYAANLVVEAGYCVVAARLDVLPVYLAAWLAVYLPTIRREEQRMRAIFGAKFDDYCRSVPRLVPWRGRVTGIAASGGFDWRNPNLSRGREYPRVLRILMAPLLIVIATRARGSAIDVVAQADWVFVVATLAVVVLEILRRTTLRRLKGADAEDQPTGNSATVGRSTSTRVPVESLSTRIVPPLRCTICRDT
jgi:protein-S-isoprenylcysteine O-methyltransferase Ste14